VTLVAATKAVPAHRLRAAVAAGHDLFGENRVQEAGEKAAEVPGARWHLVGHLQSNKARRAVELFEAIESLDSLELARRLDRQASRLRPGRRLPVFLQVNVDRDPRKEGFDPEVLGRQIGPLAELGGLELVGLMTVGRLARHPDEARPTFIALRELSQRLRAVAPSLGPALSMGMSDDFEVAVEEGATHVRVGRALFGDRPDHGT
jgi:pyridoxal phosphate enzyme (YggS family)